MGRSQRGRRELAGIDSGDFTGDEVSDFRPKRTTTTAIAAPTGTKTVGSTLTAAANPAFTARNIGGTIAVTRKWLRNGVPISGATGATYVLAAGDLAKFISVRYIATYGFGRTEVDSIATTAIA